MESIDLFDTRKKGKLARSQTGTVGTAAVEPASFDLVGRIQLLVYKIHVPPSRGVKVKPCFWFTRISFSPFTDYSSINSPVAAPLASHATTAPPITSIHRCLPPAAC
jgi:hypothetical protein